MNKKSSHINIVWLKRDLRTNDHLPLHKAEQNGMPYIILFLFEPSLMAHADSSWRHRQFQYHSILDMNKKLAAYEKKVLVCYAEAVEAFKYYHTHYHVENIYSYQESGIALSYERDKQVAAFCKNHQIHWQQYQRDGVIRGIKNRDGWDRQWFASMHAPEVLNTYTQASTLATENPFSLPVEFEAQLKEYPPTMQPAGEDNAFKYLRSFTDGRGKHYNKHISKPAESRVSCGRLSPYLSWGNISVRQAYQWVQQHIKKEKNKFPFTGFLTRLHWHCHFIQKFEVECRYETHCINAGYESLEHPRNEALIRAWEEGRTGIPLVDACMRCLHETGWINFRMRAMLVSFFCHHLFQDWRDGVYHLARLFLDYEPGIHYPQWQMQAGTTGVNTIRIYNPVKQSMEHDPEGVFIKRWVPELTNVPKEHIHEPHKMSAMEHLLYNTEIGKSYPAPVVDIEAAGRYAREHIWAHRQHPLVRAESIRIIQTHTRQAKNDLQTR